MVRTVAAALFGLACFALGCTEPPPAAPRATLYMPPAPAAATTATSATLLDPAKASAAPAQALRRVSFVVDDTLRAAALRVLTEPQLDALDRAFLGRLDLHALVPDGTAIHCWLDGDRLVAAEVGLQGGRRIRAAHFAGTSTTPAGWYDQDGLSLASEILGRPLALSRVSSRFGERLHPITGNRKKHRGVDYAAPIGTPVFAVGDGVIVALARDDHAGNHIKIEHPSGHTSWYLHLQKFAPHLQKGATVKQGETIAFVGSTGASTGPHLHYELHRSGYPLDPLAQLSLPQQALGPLTQPAHRKRLEALP